MIILESLKNKEKILPSIDAELRYRFGIIPKLTSSMLNNETDSNARIIALEQVCENNLFLKLYSILIFNGFF